MRQNTTLIVSLYRFAIEPYIVWNSVRFPSKETSTKTNLYKYPSLEWFHSRNCIQCCRTLVIKLNHLCRFIAASARKRYAHTMQNITQSALINSFSGATKSLYFVTSPSTKAAFNWNFNAEHPPPVKFVLFFYMHVCMCVVYERLWVCGILWNPSASIKDPVNFDRCKCRDRLRNMRWNTWKRRNCAQEIIMEKSALIKNVMEWHASNVFVCFFFALLPNLFLVDSQRQSTQENS